MATAKPWLAAHRFPAGRSGNPNGRRNDRIFAAFALKATGGGKAIAEALVDIMTNAPRARDRVLAAKVLADRLWGMPPERLEVERADSGLITDAELAAARQVLREDREAELAKRSAIVETTSAPVAEVPRIEFDAASTDGEAKAEPKVDEPAD